MIIIYIEDIVIYGKNNNNTDVQKYNLILFFFLCTKWHSEEVVEDGWDVHTGWDTNLQWTASSSFFFQETATEHPQHTESS